jgi:hypothetical protein
MDLVSTPLVSTPLVSAPLVSAPLVSTPLVSAPLNQLGYSAAIALVWRLRSTSLDTALLLPWFGVLSACTEPERSRRRT